MSSHSSHSRVPSSSEALEQEERNSSETTIFTIYSMYSDKRATWRGSAPPSQRQSVDRLDHLGGDEGAHLSLESDSFFLRPTSTATGTGSPGRSRRTSSDSAYRNSFGDVGAGSTRASRVDLKTTIGASRLDKHTSQESSELPYLRGSVGSTSSLNNHDSTSLPVPSTSTSTPMQNHHITLPSSSRPRQAISSWSKYVDHSLLDNNQPDLTLHRYSVDVSDNERAGLSQPQSRPPRPPRHGSPLEHREHRKSFSGDTTTNGEASVTHEGYYTAPQTIDSHIHSRMQSPLPEAVGNIGAANQDARLSTPLPPPPPPKPRTMSIGSSNKSLPPRPKTAPGPPSPTTTTPSNQSRRKSSATSLPKMTNTTSPRPSTVPSESSRASSGPSEGEDPESYFVRNVYARLDVTGVRGDGYEEGIERTRAKLGHDHDRLSVQLAALNGGKEETKEFEMLRTLDRWVHLCPL